MTARTFQATNPATGQPLSPAFPVTTPQELASIVAAASEAARGFAASAPQLRADFLNAAAAGIEARAGELIAAAMGETGLPEARLRGEVGRTANQLRLFARVAAEGSWVDARIDHGDPSRKPLPKPDVRSLRVPLGPVAVFGASNFPLAFSVAGGDTASALAAGCPVVVKAHPAHPATSRLAAEAIQEAAAQVGLPAGVFGIIYEDGYELGVQLAQHPDIHAVGFTGSRTGGLALVAAAQARDVPIPVYAEMSSVNPSVFTQAALEAKAAALADGLAVSISGSGGQLCTQPGLLFVPVGQVGDEFLQQVAARLDATPACTLLTGGILKAYQQGAAGHLAKAGIQALTQGAATQIGAQPQLLGVPLAQFTAELADEVFGPISVAVRYEDLTEVTPVLAGLEGQLTATLHATDDELDGLSDLLHAMGTRAGRVVLNGFPTGVEVGHAMVHGGPFPATSDGGSSTSVGSRAIERFTRLRAYQDFPDRALPPELQDANPHGLWRLMDGERTR
ncbi:aldehyde dehydrogenase (NADP(+)) [Deinococcus humi]|uniref:NADP-dependent aldehyde dehydrogenase n=1 Tax=Deinococcus humi TaxID=662880 RepID=A0A7W8ND21_9DEIO|nr:aldehyde dehydrogenase (NADP(+)) [Deinococcus humi]MBB5361170.1 NADP-dependent aldehyde dehydrogenase [Deinococcus humi]GGO18732.1 2,5-dioxovalerate dehydrogenase [Deinococcus humi]